MVKTDYLNSSWVIEFKNLHLPLSKSWFKVTIMKDPKANKLLDDLIKSTYKNFDTAAVAEKLTEIRAFALAEADPLATKLLRLSREYIEKNGQFDLAFEGPEEGENKFHYFIELLKGSDNKYNRKEMVDIRVLLTAK